jgi:hypothetical protein
LGLQNAGIILGMALGKTLGLTELGAGDAGKQRLLDGQHLGAKIGELSSGISDARPLSGVIHMLLVC